jgi:hypothetical protein
MGDTQTLVNGKVKAFSKNKVDFRACKKYGKYPGDSELGSINMIGLGADEQIEYRKVAAVVLGEKDEDDKSQETRKGYYLY